MSFPNSGPEYAQYGGAQPSSQPPGSGQVPRQSRPSGAAGTVNIAVLLAIAVTVLGLVNYFLTFSDDAEPAAQAVLFLLVGGLLAAVRALPNAPKVLPFAAVTSVLGGLYGILAVVQIPEGREVPGVVTVVLILGILQLLLSVAALLFDYGVIAVPEPRPPQPYGQPYGRQPPQYWSGQQAQPGQYNQYGQPSGQETATPQPTQHGPPVAHTPAQQPTQYASQQGQFYQYQAPESEQEQPRQEPGTPSGGVGQQG